MAGLEVYFTASTVKFNPIYLPETFQTPSERQSVFILAISTFVYAFILKVVSI